MVQVLPHRLQFGLDLGQSQFLTLGYRILLVLCEQRRPHFEPLDIRLELQRRCVVIFWHFDHEQLLVRDTHYP